MDKIQSLILYNQYEILKYLDESNKKSYENNQRILMNGHERSINRLTMAYHKGLNADECDFVYDILSVYESLYLSWENSEEVQKEIKEDKVLFRGFDANYEEDYWDYYEELLDEWGEWEVFKELKDQGKILTNSHGVGPSIEELKKMVEVYKGIKNPNLNNLTVKEINKILSAKSE